MRGQAPPQFSPDGYWWWTGKRWIPVQQPAASAWQQPQQPQAQQPAPAGYASAPRRRRGPGIWLALLAVIVLLALALAPELTSWVSQQLSGIGALPTTTAPPATAPPTATPAPTTSTAPQDGAGAVAAYQQLIASEAARFQAAGQAVSDRCSPAAVAGGTASCRAALQSLDDTVQSIQSDLDAQPVPPCLQPVDREVRAALALYHQGIQQELAGLDHDDPGAVLRGAGTLSQATADVRDANSLLQNACS